MHKFILGEKLKEEISGHKIKAAVFHTFNFDPDFFENYLLPLLLPDIPFGDNKIQNTILWKKYQTELPPVTVYCDFHAKAQKGIHLDYTIRTVDIPKVNGIKPCFHPKHSAILLDDDTLLMFIGSNNLTEAGWCSNLEGGNFFRLKSTVNFPRVFKDAIKNFNRGICSQFYNDRPNQINHSPAEDLIESFFAKIGYTDEVNFKFLNSKDFQEEKKSSYFRSFLNYLCLEENAGIPFKKIEIISPYYARGISIFETLTQITNCTDISCSIPFENSDYVSLDESLFQQVKELGIQWKGIKGVNETKGYRFNHSKIYQFLGEEKVFVLIGSINFTNMAWKGIRHGGNYESAVLYKLPATDYQSMLIDYPTENLSFSGAKPEENQIDDREDAFDLSFVIDWGSKEIEIINPDKQKAEIIIENLSNIRINESKKVLLNEEQLSYFSNTPLIKVKPNGINTFFYYYPIHKNINAKPLPSNINLNDTELLQLWIDLEGNKDKESTLRIIDRFIDRIMDESGDLNTIELNNTSSTLNLMATHLSGLIHLNKKLFTNGRLVKEQSAKNKMLEYYLFGDNVDTIIGYRKLISKMRTEGRINTGFYWLLLNIINKTFYQKYETLKLFEEKNKELTKLKIKELEKEIKLLGKEIENERITAAHLKWAEQILLEDA
jgi:hypothetical protein